MSTKYDYAIIGGGIAGLYSAYKIRTINPEAKIIVLEKQPKKYAGGRTGTDIFNGTTIVTGAGVGRKKKDKLLIKLLHELKIETSEFEALHHYAKTIEPSCDVKNTFLEIKKAFNNNAKPQTFREFAISIIGEERYKHFIICSGYTDYENEDAHSTLFNYGFDDNYSKWTGLSIPWDKLITTLIEKIGKTNIKFNTEVKKIKFSDDEHIITTEKGLVRANKTIIATTIDALLKILPRASAANSIYRQIHGQPFLRTYGKFSQSSQNIMKQLVPSLTVVPGPLQKIIPMNPDAGIYMIAYSDNYSAKKLNLISEDNENNRNKFSRIIEKSLGAPKNSLNLLEIADYYWKTGTHYYAPLSPEFKNRNDFIKKAQNPHKNMLVVGELISTNQGWVEGALESVDAVVNETWINKK